jgi:hypothetical protein
VNKIPIVKYITNRECDYPFDTFRRLDTQNILHDGWLISGTSLIDGNKFLRDNVLDTDYSFDEVEIHGFVNY